MKLRDLSTVNKINERRASVVRMIDQVRDGELSVKLGAAWPSDLADIARVPVLNELHRRLQAIDAELRGFGVVLEVEVQVENQSRTGTREFLATT